MQDEDRAREHIVLVCEPPGDLGVMGQSVISSTCDCELMEGGTC
jgi:hypothetical protein